MRGGGWIGNAAESSTKQKLQGGAHKPRRKTWPVKLFAGKGSAGFLATCLWSNCCNMDGTKTRQHAAGDGMTERANFQDGTCRRKIGSCQLLELPGVDTLYDDGSLQRRIGTRHSFTVRSQNGDATVVYTDLVLWQQPG